MTPEDIRHDERRSLLKEMLKLDDGILRHGRDELGDNFEEVWVACVVAFAQQHGIDLEEYL